MTRIGAIAACVAVAVTTLVAPAVSVAATSSATVVVQTSPVGPSGHLLPGYRVVRNLSGATCKSHSPETGNAYSCHVQFGYDPCWLTAKRAYVVCLSQPYDRKVTRLHVARYVNTGGLGSPKAFPWGLRLANGVNTTLIPGDFGMVSGQQIRYSYDAFKRVLVGPIDKTGPVWRIRVAKNSGRFRFKLAGWMDIQKAWIGAPTRLG